VTLAARDPFIGSSRERPADAFKFEAWGGNLPVSHRSALAFMLQDVAFYESLNAMTIPT
jgi:hypothetical protein